MVILEKCDDVLVIQEDKDTEEEKGYWTPDMPWTEYEDARR